MLDVTTRAILIVGGGKVAARKARGLIDAGATAVRAVAPEFISYFPATVARVAERYHCGHLDGAELVFAATDDPGVNEAVVRDARQRRVLVCRADSDEDDPGDFITPALWRRGPMTVTVSTGGSPALAAAVRDDLAGRIDPRWVAMADAMQVLRPRILAMPGVDIVRRRELFRALASPEALARLEQGGVEHLMRWIVELAAANKRA